MFRKSCTTTALIFAILLVFTACSSSKEAGKSQNNAASSPTAIAAAEASKPQTRTVKHALGTTEIPTKPQRIASINLEDMLLSLEVPIVLGTGLSETYYLADKLKEKKAEYAIWGDTINYEAVLASKPDLIVTSKAIKPVDYEQLSKIAPTIAFERDDWQTSITDVGKALGIEDKVSKVLADYEAKLKKGQEEISKVVDKGATVAFIRLIGKEFRVYFPTYTADNKVLRTYTSAAYQDTGLAPDPLLAQLQKEKPNSQNASVSLEKLPELTADYIFVTLGGASVTEEELKTDVASFNEIAQTKVWQSLKAVKNGHVFRVNARHWISNGPIAEGLKIEDTVRALTTAK
ncbi:putative siderophore-binding lipoprotein YfiY precursor [compost metagenome]